MKVDVLVIGSGPAALAIASELVDRGLVVEGLSPVDPAEPWPNTYGIWGPEVDRLGLGGLLGHRWSDTRSYFASSVEPLLHQVDYGLFDKQRLQAFWLGRCSHGAMAWHRGLAATIDHSPSHSTVTTDRGVELKARLVVDASGHRAAFVQRPDGGAVAAQGAYGVVGSFSAPPVRAGEFVLMDYRSDHLSAAEQRCGPPTFLYAMDMGEGLFFVEETSLALAPPVPFEVLKERLQRRLAHGGIAIETVCHEEFCLFPMNLPLPDLNQRVVGFGGAASMVHPASGYMVGALLRRAPGLADAIATALRNPAGGDSLLDGAEVAASAWQALWPLELRRKHALYCFGLEKLMRYPEAQLRQFFDSFFQLPQEQWYGFLTNTLSLPELVAAMLRLFLAAPWSVRWGLMQQQGREWALLTRLLSP
ncbi:lycopene beta cyclase [Cyanobium sp. WAJ14-Wanaka]|uniref:lycopene beta cyclase n=1 Tax=Cyanobium sp. WAJ14-Wanaka TaxID=2823725 RepID=UPI0020CB7A79|nr:lycopene cyclase family protein [Cyanobium sp. WAJ14-Wanaka]MCP9774197.1 lycopene cyclase family protein [Cyanobium sp. WAJ14-Wanaka]